jgi:hypothetical protein
MADDTLAEHLAMLLHRQHWTGHQDGACCGPTDRELADAQAIVAELAERGRLVPDGATVEEQWTMRYLLNGKPQCAEDNGHVFDSRADAERHIEAWREFYPKLIYSDVEYLRRDDITTPWEPVPATPEETTDVHL